MLIIVSLLVLRAEAAETPYPETAEAVVDAMVTAAMSQDIDAAQKFMDPDWVTNLNFLFKKSGGVKGYWSKLLNNFTAEKKILQESKIDGDVTLVPVRFEGKDKWSMNTIYRCQKKDGRWVVMGIK